MKKLIFISLLVLYPLMGCAEWQSQRHTPDRQFSSFWQNVYHRQQKQTSQIGRLIQAGLLTTPEIKKLRHQQNHLAKQINRYKRHRFLDFDDKQCILEHLNRINREIQRMAQNNRYYQPYIIYPPQRKPYSHQHYSARPPRNYSVGVYLRF